MAAVLLLPLYYCAQNTIYSEIYNYNTRVSPPTPVPDKAIIYYNEGCVYTTFSRAAFDTDVLRILEYTTQTQKIRVIELKKTKELKRLFNHYIYGIAVTKNKLIIVTGDDLLVFAKDKGTGYTLWKTLKNESSYNKVYPLKDNELLLYTNYNYHPADVLNPHTWAKFYTDRDSVGAEKYMDRDNLVFSYFTNEWLSTYKGLIASAHTTDYSIHFYSDQFIMIDSIKSGLLDKNREKLSLLPDGSGYSSDEMNKIRKADDTLLTRIEKIFLLDSTHLLVTLKQSNTIYYKFDVWQKTKGQWHLSKSQELPSHYEAAKAYTAANNSIHGFFGNGDGLVNAGKDGFYYVYFPFRENVISKSFDAQTDVFDKTNELMRKKELYYGIKKIKVLTD